VTAAVDPSRRPEAPDDPWDLLRAWLPPNDDPERPLVTLATVDDDGAPDARTVLLSEYDEQGLYVHTDARSRKAAQLAAHPAAALVLRWPEQLRQVVVRGVAEPAPADECARAYARRTPYLRRLAWVNTAELAALPVAERRSRWAAFAAERPVDTLRPPDTWVGFLVRPTSLTFWTGDPGAASRRVEYRRDADRWATAVLAG
jgi:pyridoxamine 5'-phosphate oxidase